MKLATLRSGQVAAVADGQLRAISLAGSANGKASMIEVIARHHESGPGGLVLSEDRQAVTEGDLAAPIGSPSKIWAAASNYDRGTSNPNEQRGRGEGQERTKEEILELIFMKPPSAIVGPGSSILIPAVADTIFPEVELCAVIGRRCRNLTTEQALSAVFGYTILIDVTARGYGPQKSGQSTRCIRKGYDTFAPLGPSITTSDEIPDPQALSMSLRVNGEVRQTASTQAMINTVADVVSFLSTVCTMEPGDLIATGNPDSPKYQQRLVPGDVLIAQIDSIGSMRLDVRAEPDAA